MRDPDLITRETAQSYAAKKGRLTYQDYRQIPPGPRYELVEGDLRRVDAPSIRHQEISKRLFRLLLEQFEDSGGGKVYATPCDVVLSERDVVQPDLLCITNERQGIIGQAAVNGAPDLVVEILSASTEKWDRTTKRRLYAAHGVREYWIVDPAAQTVEVASQDGSNLVTSGEYPRGTTIIRSRLLPEVELEVTLIFRE